MAEKLLPCPFCGKEARIMVCDNEGNARPESYRDDPYSGLSFWISHTYGDSEFCPVARHAQDGPGGLIYESEEEAARTWNRRAADPVAERLVNLLRNPPVIVVAYREWDEERKAALAAWEGRKK